MTEDVIKVFVQDVWQEGAFSEWLANLTASNGETNNDLHETCNASKLTEIRSTPTCLTKITIILLLSMLPLIEIAIL